MLKLRRSYQKDENPFLELLDKLSSEHEDGYIGTSWHPYVPEGNIPFKTKVNGSDVIIPINNFERYREIRRELESTGISGEFDTSKRSLVISYYKDRVQVVLKAKRALVRKSVSCEVQAVPPQPPSNHVDISCIILNGKPRSIKDALEEHKRELEEYERKIKEYNDALPRIEKEIKSELEAIGFKQVS